MREENTILADGSRLAWVHFKYGRENSIGEARKSRTQTDKDASASISHRKSLGSQRPNTSEDFGLSD